MIHRSSVTGRGPAEIAGELRTVHTFCARLAHSTRDVVVAYSQKDRAAWLDGHVAAFTRRGGAPAACWYDNASELGRLVGGQFKACEEFLALQSAYRFRAHHCNPGEGHEKGLVENLVGYFRRAYMVPIPTADSREDLNDVLAFRCQTEEQRRRRGQVQTVGERFLAERPLLAPVPEHPFLPCTRHPVRVSLQQLVTIKQRRYSVPLEHVFPGNTADAGTVQRVKDDLRGWRLNRVVFVADRGFAGEESLRYVQRGGGHLIVGERMRAGLPAVEAALSRQGRYRVVRDNLEVKEVTVGNGEARHRYVICRNPLEADRDREQREQLVRDLEAELRGLNQTRGVHAKRACALRISRIWSAASSAPAPAA